MPNGWKLYSRQWAFWAPSIELTLHTTLHCSNLTLSFSPSLALPCDESPWCGQCTLGRYRILFKMIPPEYVFWEVPNYGPHCTVRSVIQVPPYSRNRHCNLSVAHVLLPSSQLRAKDGEKLNVKFEQCSVVWSVNSMDGAQNAHSRE